ncbi:endonuclease III [Candidatus Epulonipiscium viviparus]|uniref:endonuclease III n=1 Tax=Candidatus Epulonipiscium viviparus TaxID=420336 RepID=UPI0027380CCB|nr:endonuclease III [Candidatus Epulopiscium viviparus]
MKANVGEILKILNLHYPKDVPCFLNHSNPFELLVATILSAQCTDERVNIITATLFRKYPCAESFASASAAELEMDIKSAGFYKNKAKNIIATAATIVDKYDGQVPSEIEDLVQLAGVGRKTANVIRGNIYHIPSIVVDTHVKRISTRWGFTESADPTKIEYELMELLPEEEWISYNIQVIMHGRAICTARNPRCSQCMFLEQCPYELKQGIE